jgi:protein O-mannosyl-transferase
VKLTPPAASAPRRTADALDALIAGVLVVATLAVYAPVRHHAFVNYDDPEYVTENPLVRSGLTAAGVRWALTGIHHATWHPLTTLSHLLDVELFGLDAGAHLTVNVTLHALAAVALFAVWRTMTGARWASAWVAGVFALHPLHVESVGWVSERKDVLSGLFWMLTLGCWIRYVRRPSRARSVAVATVFALGLAAKPMLVTLPFVLLLLDVWPLGRTATVPLRTRLVEKLPLLALAVADGVVTLLTQTRVGAVATLAAVPLGDRVANALLAYVRYLRKAVWPSDLAVFYPIDTTFPLARVAAAAALLAAITALAVRARARRPYLLVGWLWYLGTLVPVLGIIRQGEQAMADRFTYLPLIGVTVMVAWTAADVLGARGRTLLALAGAATLVAAALVTVAQVAVWRDSVTLFRHALAVTRDNYVAHTNLAAALDATDPDEAARHYAEAIRLKPTYAKAQLNYGVALARRGEVDAAEAHYAEALRLDPGSAMAEYDWGKLRAERGDLDAAIGHYERALALDPRYAKAYNNLGWALAARGDLAGAEANYRQALALAPDLTAAHNNLAVVLERQGRTADALAHAGTASRLAPDEPRAHANYAALLATAGRFDEAIAEYREALRLAPDLEGVRDDLAAAVAARDARPR